jgi:hypothetical protein
MAPLICRVINALGQGIPNAHVTLDGVVSQKCEFTRHVTFTEANGYTHFWTTKSQTSRSGWARILEDNNSISGLLHVHTHWGVIPIEVELAGEKSHYILIQLIDTSAYQVQHFEFLTPVAMVHRYGQWSAEEDETLIELKRKGFNSRTRHSLLLFASSHHSEEFYSYESISGARTSHDNENSRIPQSTDLVYKFVLDSHSELPELQADLGTQQDAQAGTIVTSTAKYHDLVWVDENDIAAGT